MLNASKLRDDSKLGARLSEEAIENHIRYTQEYLTLLATNVQQIHAEEALNEPLDNEEGNASSSDNPTEE